jgi:hypothetical protein
MFKDETNFFASLNCDDYFNYVGYCCNGYGNWYYYNYNIGTYYYGGLIFASNNNLYSSCYNIPSISSEPRTMTD